MEVSGFAIETFVLKQELTQGRSFTLFCLCLKSMKKRNFKLFKGRRWKQILNELDKKINSHQGQWTHEEFKSLFEVPVTVK
jgi:hypothetical protein